MRESVRNAVLYALDQQRNDSSANIWLERRIFRPAQQIFERAIHVKKPSLPPPSVRGAKSDADVTGTWKKVPGSSRRPGTAVPAPPSLTKDAENESASALERALARPDRASVPPAKRPTPPPPGVQRKTPSTAAAPFEPLSLERIDVATEETPSGLASSAPSDPISASIPPVSPSPGETNGSLEGTLAALDHKNTPRDQASFLLALILEIAPAKSILLHTIDARTQEATTVGAHGAHAAVLSDFTTEAQDPLLTQIRRLRRPVKILSPSTDERSGKGRWAFEPPQKYLVALPVLHGHKLLGFIELADPLHANRLGQEQLEALLELAKAWGARLEGQLSQPNFSRTTRAR